MRFPKDRSWKIGNWETPIWPGPALSEIESNNTGIYLARPRGTSLFPQDQGLHYALLTLLMTPCHAITLSRIEPTRIFHASAQIALIVFNPPLRNNFRTCMKKEQNTPINDTELFSMTTPADRMEAYFSLKIITYLNKLWKHLSALSVS